MSATIERAGSGGADRPPSDTGLRGALERARRWPDVREAARRLAIRLFDRPLVGRYTLLDLPIIHKLVIANSVLVGLAVVGGMWFVHSSLWPALRDIHAGLTAVGVMVAVTLAGGVNYLIVRTALAPLESLQRTVEAVRRGDVGARAGVPLLSAPGVELFRLAINDMLDEMAHDRERLRALSAGLLTAQEGDEDTRRARAPRRGRAAYRGSARDPATGQAGDGEVECGADHRRSHRAEFARLRAGAPRRL